MQPAERQRLLRWFEDYALAHADVAEVAALFRDLVLEHADCCARTLAFGHLTGSAWLVDRDGTRVLLTHHRKLGRWLQLGGHADGDPDLAQVALREAMEESGLYDLVLESDTVFDLDRHWIPARAAEPGHWHYDVRFVVRAGADDRFAVSDESHALAWRPIADVAADPTVDESLRRMACRWLARAK
jgi:8-oxo-dGTP pyrophosphatase MutT (NUDIX family)